MLRKKTQLLLSSLQLDHAVPLLTRSVTALKQPAAEEAVDQSAHAANGWLKNFAKSKASIIVGGAVGLVALQFLTNQGLSWWYESSVYETLQKGLLPDRAPLAAKATLLERSDVRSQLRQLLQPKTPTRFFHIISGPPGSGKTTIVRQACEEMGGGVGYINVNPCFGAGLPDFGRDLGEAFNFRLEEHVTIFNVVTQLAVGSKLAEKGSGKLMSLRRAADALGHAAKSYKQKSGRPFILVIDSVERLSGDKSSEEGAALTALVEYAKHWAEEGSLTTVFITSDRKTVNALMGGNAVAVRSSNPLMIGDVDGKEARAFLKNLGIHGSLAQQCIDLVGGSLLQLERCAGTLNAGYTFDQVRKEMLLLMAQGYKAAGLLDATDYQKEGMAVIKALLKADGQHQISLSQWRTLVPTSDHQDALLAGYVLQMHDDAVHFGSKLSENFARDMLPNQLSREALAYLKG